MFNLQIVFMNKSTHRHTYTCSKLLWALGSLYINKGENKLVNFRYAFQHRSYHWTSVHEPQTHGGTKKAKCLSSWNSSSWGSGGQWGGGEGRWYTLSIINEPVTRCNVVKGHTQQGASLPRGKVPSSGSTHEGGSEPHRHEGVRSRQREQTAKDRASGRSSWQAGGTHTACVGSWRTTKWKQSRTEEEPVWEADQAGYCWPL